MSDLLGLAAELVEIPSVSHHEAAVTDYIQSQLRSAGHLRADRLGNNLVARTDFGRRLRLVLAGHVDTVPSSGNEHARIEGSLLHGLGAVDMKSGIAVLLRLAQAVAAPAVDVTYVFYECEEVAARHNGLRRLFEEAAPLLAADAAILAEPTGAQVEAGCQGTMRVQVAMRGKRAHTARAWLGQNAIHRLAPVLSRLQNYQPRRPTIGGCQYHEGLQAVQVEGGVAGNVVPDRVQLTINHRFAPDRSPAQAEAHVRDVLGEVDEFEIVDLAPGAAPGLEHPLLAALLERGNFSPKAKLGWTDVARFSEQGVPALNFGPGDPSLAHTAEERVDREQLELAYAALHDLLMYGPIEGCA